MSLGLLLVIIGVILMVISAFVEPTPRVSLWRLGWACVVAGALLFGGVAVNA